MGEIACSHPGCGREASIQYKDGRRLTRDGKCIFHCTKDDWFTTDAYGNHDWSKSKDFTKQFWAEFEDSWKRGKSDFSNFVFPIFAGLAAFLRDKSSRALSSEDAKQILQFHHAIFLGGADFSKVTFTQITSFASATFAEVAYFGGATFKQFADFMRATFTKDASFSDEAIFNKEAIFAEAKFQAGANFTRASFNDNAIFRKATFTRDTIFEATTFLKEAIFEESTFAQKVNFNKATFTLGAIFNDATFESEAKFFCAKVNERFRGGRFNKEAVFTGMKYGENTVFESVQFEGPASFMVLEYGPPVKFINIKVKDRFDFGETGEPQNAPTDYFKYRAQLSSLETLTFTDCDFGKEAIVYIGNLTIGTLVMERQVNFSSAVKLVGLHVTKELSIRDSNLSGVELSNVDLSSAETINIINSSVIKTIFNNVEWGEVERINKGRNDLRELKADRDTFRQLKAANEEQKNYIQANEFYGREMEEYGKEIEGRGDKKQERLEFWFGNKVSRFSNDWVRPIIILILMTLPFYLASQLYSNYKHLESGTSVFYYYGHYFKMIPCNFLTLLKALIVETDNFLAFMNPLEAKYENHGTPALIWIPYKVLAGLIYYQIIISLRRKTRH